METENIRNLASAVLLQAMHDYFNTTAGGKAKIIKELNSTWMDFLTDGYSEIVAEQLVNNPERIKKYIKREASEGLC